MEKFATLAFAFLIFVYFYIISLKLNSFFKNAKEFLFSGLCTFIFTYLLFCILFIFIDILTTSTNKQFLNFKEKFALNFILIFEIFIMILFPSLYVNLLYRETRNKKYLLYFFSYVIGLFLLNISYLIIMPLIYNNSFSQRVPEGLAFYGKINQDFEKIVYFNFGFLMMIGKFLGFTYLPIGMAKYVHDLIYKENIENLQSEYNSNLNTCISNLIISNTFDHYNSESFPIEKNNSDHTNNSQNNFFSNSNGNTNILENSQEKEEIDSFLLEKTQKISIDSNNSIITNYSTENNTKKYLSVQEYLIKLNEMEINSKLKNIKHYSNFFKSNFKFMNIYYKNCFFNILMFFKQLSYIFYVLICILIIIGIIETKISILYTKLMYSICGVDCGLLAYRFDDNYTLESVTNFLLNISSSIRYDFLFFSFILIFRCLTVYKGLQDKGLSFLWKIFYKPDSEYTSYQIIQFYGTILYTGVVLLYDFTYLFPDYVRFNGLDPVCDYSLINQSYCGVSFYGLLFIKISMNYHIFMYFDILASGVFITNGIIWAFRLIIKPISKSIVYYCKPESWKQKNVKLNLI